MRIYNTDGVRFFDLSDDYIVDGYVDWDNVRPEQLPTWMIKDNGSYDLDHVRYPETE